MQYVQNNTNVSESRLSWKPMPKNSYLSKLNSFAADNAMDFSYSNQNTASYGNQEQNWTPAMNSNNGHTNQYHKMNTWNSA